MPYLADAIMQGGLRFDTNNPGILEKRRAAGIIGTEVNAVDRRPVGVFDSGLGGISVLGQMLEVLPEENFVYYGDIRNVPYGDKRPEEVLRLTHLAVDKLIAMDCKAVVIACNTAPARPPARCARSCTCRSSAWSLRSSPLRSCPETDMWW